MTSNYSKSSIGSELAGNVFMSRFIILGALDTSFHVLQDMCAACMGHRPDGEYSEIEIAEMFDSNCALEMFDWLSVLSQIEAIRVTIKQDGENEIDCTSKYNHALRQPTESSA
jgi:hypothetical protein